MFVQELIQYPILDNLDYTNLDIRTKVKDYLSEFGFFYIKDTINARTKIDVQLDNLENSVDVYYGEDAYTGKGSIFHGTYNKFEDINTKGLDGYFYLINQLLDLISLSFGYQKEFFKNISLKENCGLYLYDREEKYMNFIKNVNRQDIAVSPHMDKSLLTIVVSIKGLEGYSKKFNWFSVPDKQNYLIIQAGTLLQEITKGKVKANIHRVRGFDSSKAIFWGNLEPVTQ